MSKPGRNDPCWCGSGKKYKKCHWSQDQEEAVARARQEEQRREALEALGTPTDAEMRERYEQLTHRPAPAGPLPDQARDAIVELWRLEKLAAQAEVTLDEQRAEIEAHFAEYPEAFDQIAREIGQDRYFNQYELTNANRTKVLRQLGSWPTEVAEQDAYAQQAIAISFDDADRDLFNKGLREFIPRLVEEERFREAVVVLTCAERVLDPEAPITPLLADVVERSVTGKKTPISR